MTYTGKTQVGGPAQVRELPFVILSKLAVGPYDNNVYLLRCRETGEQLLIDAAADPEAILALVGPDGLAAIVTTHEHADHWQALGPVAAATGATTFAGRLDANGIPVATDILVDDGDVIAFGAVTLRAIHLVGHTPGSIALVYDDPDGHPHHIRRGPGLDLSQGGQRHPATKWQTYRNPSTGNAPRDQAPPAAGKSLEPHSAKSAGSAGA